MKSAQAVCNYAILRFRPYAETEEFVNVGVLMMCQQFNLLRFEAEKALPARAKALFPMQSEQRFAAALEALTLEMKRVIADAREPKAVQLAFSEAVRVRESIFRFGEVRTIITAKPQDLAVELFSRYVRMEIPVAQAAELVSA